jgi:hypothetical protein
MPVLPLLQIPPAVPLASVVVEPIHAVVLPVMANMGLTVTITERNWYLHEKVKEHLGEKTFIEKIESYRPEDFTLNNYQSHPAIKAKLSN